jgi:hypothetical protein
MHGYSTDSNERRVVPFFLAALAIALAWLLSRLLAATHFSVPWWVDAPSSMGLYGALYTLFDKHLWRSRFIRKLGLVRVPNLTGRWRGFLTSSFDAHVKQREVKVQISQTWTQISIALSTATSQSRSCVAAIQVADPDCITLIYQYENHPQASALRNMHMHFGTAMLRISNSSFLVGDYYAGPDRGTFGRIACSRLWGAAKAA